MADVDKNRMQKAKGPPGMGGSPKGKKGAGTQGPAIKDSMVRHKPGPQDFAPSSGSKVTGPSDSPRPVPKHIGRDVNG